MTINEVYDYYYRNWQYACRQLKLGKNTYQYWKKKNYIPISTQIRIEKATNGELKADVQFEEN